ncbi:MAG TPA: ROK family protein [Caulobacteraceae bacterium]|jgi:fructokinase
MIRIGVDFGGTKIEAAALDAEGAFQARVRAPNPGEYEAARALVRDLVGEAEKQAGAKGSIGIGTPGSISPKTGLMRNSNSLYLNGRPFREDLEQTLGRPVRMANDANCLALSEAMDGAAAGAGVVFAAILGTGCGGGLVANGRLIEGKNGVTGEWGHNPLPWPRADELPAPECWCGKPGCLELYISGTGLKADYQMHGGQTPDAQTVVARARAGEADAAAALDRYIDRLGRALATVVNLVDPDAIVLGGGMSNVEELYARVPAVAAGYVFSDVFETPIVAAAHGDSSGVRGAAWLWPPP